ncbi:MAG: twin-arginine translocase TatA/TatE family subunit [Coriobacteriia bacterium]|nr:twin-arginine translocase TatA/TatE family subunit [Coriobacteriia bacterium]
MFGISGTELLIVAVFAFIVFGPDKIPEIARTISKAVNMFKKTQEDMERLVKAEVMGIDPEKVPSSDSADSKSSATTTADTTKKATTASSLYGLDEVEEEEEE